MTPQLGSHLLRHSSIKRPWKEPQSNHFCCPDLKRAVNKRRKKMQLHITNYKNSVWFQAFGVFVPRLFSSHLHTVLLPPEGNFPPVPPGDKRAVGFSGVCRQLVASRQRDHQGGESPLCCGDMGHPWGRPRHRLRHHAAGRKQATPLICSEADFPKAFRYHRFSKLPKNVLFLVI